MAKGNDSTEEDNVQKLYDFVLQEMKVGADKSTIVQKLVDMGVDRSDAISVVDTIYTETLKAANDQQFTSDAIIPAAIGGGLAALVGGGIWGMIVITTGYVIGFMAWGLGLLSGFAVVLFSRGRKGVPLQVIAVISSIFGIAIGKYFTFYYYFKKAIEKDQGMDVASNLSVFSEKVIQIFLSNVGSMLSGFDILWVIFALITAWRIPKGIGFKPSSYQQLP